MATCKLELDLVRTSQALRSYHPLENSTRDALYSNRDANYRDIMVGMLDGNMVTTPSSIGHL